MYKRFVEDIQRGAIRFSEEFNRLDISSYVGTSASNMLVGLELLGKEPNKRELENVGNYPFHLGVGVVNAAAPKFLIRYIANPRTFLLDFSNSTWKVAFLKRLLKIKLPYYKIFCWIYKHKT